MIVGDAEAREILTLPRVARLMELTLIAHARGAADNPVRTVLESGAGAEAGWFATMPARVDLGSEGEREFGVAVALGAKLVTAFPANRSHGLPTHRALVASIDPRDGRIAALVDGDGITELRTAAVSALAARRLAQHRPARLAILGCGVQGFAHLAAFASAGLAGEVAAWSRDGRSAAALADEARRLGIAHASAAATPVEALRGAGLVVTATSASEPFFPADAVVDGALVCAVGSCVPTRRELPARLVAGAALVVDDRAAAEREAGDVLLARSELGLALEPHATLGELLADPARDLCHLGKRVVLFESLGLGIEDIACAAFVAASAGRAVRRAER